MIWKEKGNQIPASRLRERGVVRKCHRSLAYDPKADDLTLGRMKSRNYGMEVRNRF